MEGKVVADGVEEWREVCGRGAECINFNFVCNSRFTFCVCPHTRLYIPRVNHFHRLLERLFSFIFLPSLPPPRRCSTCHSFLSPSNLVSAQEKRLRGEEAMCMGDICLCAFVQFAISWRRIKRQGWCLVRELGEGGDGSKVFKNTLTYCEKNYQFLVNKKVLLEKQQ